MRLGEIVGGVAVVGLLVLLVLAVTDDGTPDTITADTSPFVFDSAAPTTVAAVAPAGVGTTAETGSSPTTAAATTVSLPPSTIRADVPSTTTLVPPEGRPAISVQVINAGSPPRSATAMTARLREAGFDPAPPTDASSNVDATRVLFAPGAEAAAATVNSVVGAPADRVRPAGDDPNWASSGGQMAVLVVLGPAGP